MKATLKISESHSNPAKLYFLCANGRCKYYLFWASDSEKFRSDATYGVAYIDRHDIHEQLDDVHEQLKVIITRIHNLEAM